MTPGDALDELLEASEAERWRRGELRHLLHPGQREVYDAIAASSADRFVLEIARRFGKTVLHVVTAFEACLRQPGVRVVYGAPTLKMLREFVFPAFALVSAHAPEEYRPTFNTTDSHYCFPNGSFVHLFGADDERQAARGRGSDAVLAIFDEAGFCPVLDVVLKDVFRPSLQLTEGRILLGSTPADQPEHPFTLIAEIEEQRGNYARRTWHDNPMLSDARRAELIAEMAAEEGLTPAEYVLTAKYRREYLAERVVDPVLVAVPEWEEARKTQLVRVPLPKLYRGQVGIDFGGADPHAVGFHHWDPARGLVQTHELYLRGDETTAELGERIKQTEREAWGVNSWSGTLACLRTEELNRYFAGQAPDFMRLAAAQSSPPQPWARWCDTDVQLAKDLRSNGLLCIPTRKDDKQLQVDAFRVLVRKRQFWLDPRCVETDKDLRATTWANLRREQWARRGGRHGDCLDQAVYVVRNLNREVPLEDGQQRSLKSVMLGDSPMARKLARR